VSMQCSFSPVEVVHPLQGTVQVTVVAPDLKTGRAAQHVVQAGQHPGGPASAAETAAFGRLLLSSRVAAGSSGPSLRLGRGLLGGGAQCTDGLCKLVGWKASEAGLSMASLKSRH
jgi:hypothetical protein